jgi:hypothetical protein
MSDLCDLDALFSDKEYVLVRLREKEYKMTYAMFDRLCVECLNKGLYESRGMAIHLCEKHLIENLVPGNPK